MNVDKHIRKSSLIVAAATVGIGITWAVGGGCSPGNTTAASNAQKGTGDCPPTTGMQAAGRDAGATGGAAALGSSLITEGRQTFRFDTFGDEAFWGDTLKLHQAIAGAAQRRRRARASARRPRSRSA